MNNKLFHEISKIAEELGPQWAFLHFSPEDIKQEVWVYALELIKQKNFPYGRSTKEAIYKHVKNGLIARKYQYKHEILSGHALYPGRLTRSSLPHHIDDFPAHPGFKP